MAISTWVNLWYPERGQSSRTAKKICQSCPVRGRCVMHASMISERFGIWGGLQVNERRQR